MKNLNLKLKLDQKSIFYLKTHENFEAKIFEA